MTRSRRSKLPLLAKRPADLEETVQYRGKRRLYAQLRFGSHGTKRIAIVLDEHETNKLDVYVDANRDRRITAEDHVKVEGKTWRLQLELARSIGGRIVFDARPVLLERHASLLAFAPIGYVEGRSLLGERNVLVRRVDADGNGRYSDPKDRLLIDLDGNGRFARFDEVFLFSSLLMIGGKRWVVRENASDAGCSFAKLEGTGTLRLSATKQIMANVHSLTVTLQSK